MWHSLLRFFSRQQRLTTWMLSLILLSLVAINMWMFHQGLSVVNPQVPDQPILSLPNGDLLAAADQELLAVESRSWRSLLTTVGLTGAFCGLLIGFNLLSMRRSKQRD